MKCASPVEAARDRATDGSALPGQPASAPESAFARNGRGPRVRAQMGDHETARGRRRVASNTARHQKDKGEHGGRCNSRAVSARRTIRRHGARGDAGGQRGSTPAAERRDARRRRRVGVGARRVEAMRRVPRANPFSRARARSAGAEALEGACASGRRQGRRARERGDFGGHALASASACARRRRSAQTRPDPAAAAARRREDQRRHDAQPIAASGPPLVGRFDAPRASRGGTESRSDRQPSPARPQTGAPASWR